MKTTLTFLLLLIVFHQQNLRSRRQDSIALQREARGLLREGNELYQRKIYRCKCIAYRKALDKNSSIQESNL